MPKRPNPRRQNPSTEDVLERTKKQLWVQLDAFYVATRKDPSLLLDKGFTDQMKKVSDAVVSVSRELRQAKANTDDLGDVSVAELQDQLHDLDKETRRKLKQEAKATEKALAAQAAKEAKALAKERASQPDDPAAPEDPVERRAYFGQLQEAHSVLAERIVAREAERNGQ